MGTKAYDNFADLITFSRASGGTALRHVGYGDELVSESQQNGSASNSANYAFVEETVSGVEAGKVYAYSYRARNTGDPAQYTLSGFGIDVVASQSVSWNVVNAGALSTSFVTYTGVFVAPSTALEFGIRAYPVTLDTTTVTVEYDSLSVREIDPLSVSIQMDGTMTYADEDTPTEVAFVRWFLDANNRINTELSTASTNTGRPFFIQRAASVLDQVAGAVGAYSPGINVPFNIASRHGSTFINGAVDGVALTADTTPTALPDLSATALQVGYDHMATSVC